MKLHWDRATCFQKKSMCVQCQAYIILPEKEIDVTDYCPVGVADCLDGLEHEGDCVGQ